MVVRVLQTCDNFKYREMLAATGRTAERFCQNNSCEYTSYIGIKRGFHPWHAAYNRIVLFKEMYDEGFRGWLIYLDADAFIVDLSFPIHQYLEERSSYLMVARSVFPEKAPTWDINNGVLLINFDHSLADTFIGTWYDSFMAISDAELQGAPNFGDLELDDQWILHRFLEKDQRLVDAIFFESPEVINSTTASFIRQILRSNAIDGFEARVKRIKTVTDAIISITA